MVGQSKIKNGTLLTYDIVIKVVLQQTLRIAGVGALHILVIS